MNKNLKSIKPKTIYKLIILFASCFIMLPNAMAKNDDVNEIDENFRIFFQSLGVSHVNAVNDVARMFQSFSASIGNDDNETDRLLNQWATYIVNVSSHSNSDYAAAIEKEHADYKKAVDKLGEIIINRDKNRKIKYSIAWIDDLINHFGKDYIIDNKDAVRACIMYFSNSIVDENYENWLKETIYLENMLLGSYRKYFDLFLDFYNGELNKNEQNILQNRKKFVDSFLLSINRAPITSMSKTALLDKTISENVAYSLDKKIFLFLKNSPIMHDIDPMKALDDFEKTIK